MKTNLVWFRNDLRVHDNTALYKACQSDKEKVIALFIDTPEQWSNHFFSKKKLSFISFHIVSLEKELFKLNIPLYYHKSNNFIKSVKYLIYFCEKNRINNLFYNYQYEINERNRDCLVKKKLSEKGISVKGFHDNLLISNKKIKNQKNQTYKVFSFFKNTIIDNLYKNIPECFPIPLKRKIHKNYIFHFFSYKKLDINFNNKTFPIGEKKAINCLKYFCENKIHDYTSKRNFPYLNNTSMLSPYLSAGIISSRQCLQMILKAENNITSKFLFNSVWFNQILWREFYYHLLIGFPQISYSQSLSEWEKDINWSENYHYFDSWKKGKTGFPIIDAGMRQLKKIGWMHNRLRMITSSFLVKNLFINWRHGEKYFMLNLIDGDFALNNGGWQWSASIGTDSVPYTRFFNPLSQSKFFDSEGAFIKKFVPELKDVPNNYIHAPHEWFKKQNYKTNYPDPIINYAESKKKNLLVFNKARLTYKNRFKKI